MIGTLDSARTQVVMETLLQRIVETGAEVAIIDITGVPTVDTLMAQHLLKTVTAARLMGADCIISGIRPQIAQTIVHLGVDLGDVVTKATLADAFATGAASGSTSAWSARPPRAPSRGRRGPHPDPQDGRVPPGHDPGGHARPARHDAAGDLTDRISRTGARGVLIDISLAGDGGLLHRPHAGQHRRRWRGCSTPRRWWSACSRRWRSRWSSSACRCPACARRSTWSGAWTCSAAPVDGRDGEASDGRSSGVRLLEIRSSNDVVRCARRCGNGRSRPGFSLVDQTKIVTAASELARNTLELRRGRHGAGRAARTTAIRRGLRLTFEDRGPGIAGHRAGARGRLHHAAAAWASGWAAPGGW